MTNEAIAVARANFLSGFAQDPYVSAQALARMQLLFRKQERRKKLRRLLGMSALSGVLSAWRARRRSVVAAMR